MKAFFVVVLILLANNSFAQVWSAPGPGPGNWNDPLNWSPNVVPAMGNTAVFNGSSNVNCVLNIAPSVGAIQISGYTGNIDLNLNNLTITGGAANSFFNSGSISGSGNISINSNFAVTFGGTTTGASVNIAAVLATSAGVFTGNTGTTFGGMVTVTAHSILLNGSIYNGTTSLTKSSGATASASIGDGGNRFNGTTTIINAMNAAFISANVNRDIFNGPLTLSLNGSSPNCKIQMAYTAANNEFNNNVRVRSEDNSAMATSAATSEISFGANGGTSTLAPTYTITELNNTYHADGAVDEFLWGDLLLANFTQSGTTSQVINLRIPENEDPSVMRLKLIIRNCVFNGPVTFSASNLFVSNSTFNGSPTNTFIKTAGGGSDINYNPVPHSTSSWDGGNTFNNNTVIRNLGVSTMGHALVTGDVFNGNVTFRSQHSTSGFKLAYRGTTQYKGNITFEEFAAGTPVVDFGDVVQGGIVEFNGSSAQSILQAAGQAFTLSFHELRMNNSSGLTLGMPISIATMLNLISGVIRITDNSHFVQILTNAIVSGAQSDRFVDGQVRKAGTTAFTFPIGDNASYHPLRISAPGVASEFSAHYIMTDHNNGALMDAPLVKVSNCEYWILDRLSGAGNVAATLYWNNDASFCHANYITDPNEQQLRVASWSGATHWNTLGGIAIDDTASPDGTEGNVTSAVVVPAFPRTLTFGSETELNMLPVELLSFVVRAGAHGAELNWQCSSENNNEYFTIERFQGEQFLSVAKVQGAGTTNLLTNYEWTDTNPLPGLSHYRLRQTDFDGKETVSEVVSFHWDKDGSPYPNPVKNILSLDRISFDENSRVSVTDVGGRVVYAGQATKTIDFSEFKFGIYYLMVNTGEFVRWYSIRKE